MAEIDVYEVETEVPAGPIVTEKRCYSVDEVVEILQVSRPTIYDLINRKVFRSVKVGGKHRISKKSFDNWLDNQE